MRNRLTIILVVAAMLGGCASGPATRSGFLSDYTELKPENGKDSILAKHPPISFQAEAYHAVFIEKPRVDVARISQAEADQLREVFTIALTEQFASSRRLVQRPGIGVLYVRAAITEARKSNVALNIATTLLGAPVSAGSVSCEAEILDGGSRIRIVALSWTRRGQMLAELPASFASLGQARRGLRAFAKRLVSLIEPPEATTSQRQERR